VAPKAGTWAYHPPMYYDLLARFSTAVEALAPRLLRVEVVIPLVVLLIIGLGLSWLSVGTLVLAAVAALALYGLFVLWMADRHARRRERDGAGVP
jgi:ABC-type transport system involved in cytochrome bd biosynthesis fused ATPase/permease subunit